MRRDNCQHLVCDGIGFRITKITKIKVSHKLSTQVLIAIPEGETGGITTTLKNFIHTGGEESRPPWETFFLLETIFHERNNT